MVSQPFRFFLSLSFVAISFASVILQRTAQTARDLNSGISSRSSSGETNRLIKRANARTVVVNNINKDFEVPVSIGLPSIENRLKVDFWSTLCWASPDKLGLGDISASKTLRTTDIRNIKSIYPDGSSSRGNLVTDILSIGSSDIYLSDFIFGVVSSGSLNSGALGLGIDEEPFENELEGQYKGFLARLVTENYINDRVYSIRWDMKSLSAKWTYTFQDDLTYTVPADENLQSNASLIFGGIDTNGYKGHLMALPVTRQDSVYTMELSMFSVSSTLGPAFLNDSFTAPAFLDSSQELIKFPREYLDPLLVHLGVATLELENEGQFVVPCTHLTSPSEVTFGFNNGPTIAIPLSKLVTERDDGTCIINIVHSPADYSKMFILGTNFQRYAYTVFDLSRRQILMAPAAVGPASDSSQKIVEVSGLGDGINRSGVPDIEGEGPGSSVYEFHERANASRLPPEAIAGVVISAAGVTVIITLVILYFNKKRQDEKDKYKEHMNWGYVHPMFQQSSSTGSFSDISLEGQGWVIETTDGIKHAGFVRKGTFSLE